MSHLIIDSKLPLEQEQIHAKAAKGKAKLPHLSAYSRAGVDTRSGADFAAQIKKLQKESAAHGQSPFADKVYPSRMNFASLMDVSFLKDYRQPLLVSAADGVGTKLHLAQLFDYHESVGIDLVAMCTNDLLCSAAKPVQFLDYIACGKLASEAMQQIIKSILKACQLAGCVLVGGETAEHPATMRKEQYDLAGFALGVLEAQDLIDGSHVKVGDVLIGLPSSGVHSNGLSLIRKLYLKDGLQLPDSKTEQDFLFHQILRPPTLVYEPILRPLLDKAKKLPIKGIAHITGGAFFENIPRILKDDLAVSIKSSAWEVPELFRAIAKGAELSFLEMLHIFNMGIGMVLIVSPQDSKAVLSELALRFKTVYPEIKAPPLEIGQVLPRKKAKEALLVL